MNRDAVFNTTYSVEYLVQASSAIGEVSGAGWYANGSEATVSIVPSIVPKDFFTNYVFGGWIEDGVVVSTSPTYSFIVTGPVVLVASWSTGLNIAVLIMLVAILVILLLLILLIILVKRRTKRKLQPPPPPPPP